MTKIVETNTRAEGLDEDDFEESVGGIPVKDLNDTFEIALGKYAPKNVK